MNDILDQNKEIISVGELNRSAKMILESNFSSVSVLGEISNLAQPSSGHIYFTLKDAEGSIRCAMFKNQKMRMNFTPKDGDQCVLKGQVSLYAARGDYQLIVRQMQPAGVGNLMQQFEELKQKLDKEGLFDPLKKKDIPSPPKHIGVITSASTAALQDVITTIKRRAPSSQVTLSPAMVQGDTAPQAIIKALDLILLFNETSANPIDIVLMTRGGGSIEDLWAFNNEDLAREIYDFPIPVISGVGHEIDFTIADFVADMRAPTPTAAAELATEFQFQLGDRLQEVQLGLTNGLRNILQINKQKLDLLESNLKSPQVILNEQKQKLDNIELRLKQAVEKKFLFSQQSLALLKQSIAEKNPYKIIKELLKDIDLLSKDMIKSFTYLVENKSKSLEKINSNLHAFSPLAVLDRGYAIVQNASGQAIKNSQEVQEAELVTTRLSSGSFKSKIAGIKHDK
ncbi:exodeoxyribonuclease VII large subunit [Gammaproteobacteria bacterium]|nr:exodeoxyribonuclease VII large subunit [Gammaproteobacteria bacterium]